MLPKLQEISCSGYHRRIFESFLFIRSPAYALGVLLPSAGPCFIKSLESGFQKASCSPAVRQYGIHRTAYPHRYRTLGCGEAVLRISGIATPVSNQPSGYNLGATLLKSNSDNYGTWSIKGTRSTRPPVFSWSKSGYTEPVTLQLISLWSSIKHSSAPEFAR